MSLVAFRMAASCVIKALAFMLEETDKSRLRLGSAISSSNISALFRRLTLFSSTRRWGSLIGV
ncbi:hypothetical protein D3C80_2205480 [compost metagenome]